MSRLELIVNGRRYQGWKAVRVTRSIESLAGSFALEVNDRWANQRDPWPIAEEDACRVEIEGIAVIDGFIDERDSSLAGTSRALSYTGRDRSAVLVDCSTILDRWTFRNANILDVARQIAAPFGIEVSIQAGLQLPPPKPKIVVQPGDRAFDVLQREAVVSGVLLVSDGAGGVLITRAGARRANTSLIEGRNVLAASVKYSATERYRRYVVATQIPGTDEASGAATRVRAEAIDEGVRRSERVLMILPEAGITADYARRRADWEARIRAARAETVSVTVLGWRQPAGPLWPVNTLVRTQVPSIGINGDMLISGAEHSLSAEGETTQLRLVRPDAFSPEPQAVVRKAEGVWKELAGGAR